MREPQYELLQGPVSASQGSGPNPSTFYATVGSRTSDDAPSHESPAGAAAACGAPYMKVVELASAASGSKSSVGAAAKPVSE